MHTDERKLQIQGFTLIELLIVVAIISLLASILFPVFARARENARRASCISNMKQIGLGFMMYVQDNDERYPANYIHTDTNHYWQEIISPYTKSEQIYNCPSTENHSNDVTNGQYGVNQNVIVLPTKAPISLAALAVPTVTYMMLDYGRYSIDPKNVVTPQGKNSYLPGTGDYVTPAAPPAAEISSGYQDDFHYGRHFNGVNITFADGHVKWLKSTVVLAKSRNLNQPNPWDPTKPE